MEHRWGERRSVYVPVRLDARPRVLAPGSIRNASLSGAYIQTTASLEPGAFIDIQFEGAPAPDDENCGVRACVVRRDAAGLAVEWCEFAPEPVRALLAHTPPQDGGSPSHASQLTVQHGAPSGFAARHAPQSGRPGPLDTPRAP